MIKPVFIESTTLDDTWHQLLFELYKNGRKYEITTGSFCGSSRLVFDYVSGFIYYPHSRPLSPIIPEGRNDIPAPTTDENIEKYFTEYLMNSELEPNEEYKYATWIVGSNTDNEYHGCKVNQVEWIINHFKIHGYGNEHCYITIGNPNSLLAYDKPYLLCTNCNRLSHRTIEKQCIYCGCKDLTIDESQRGTSPCLRGLDFRIINDCGKNYLYTNVIYRSWSLYDGFPVNMGGFTLLNEYIANELNIEPGPLSYSCKSLHAYSHNLDIINKRVS